MKSLQYHLFPLRSAATNFKPVKLACEKAITQYRTKHAACDAVGIRFEKHNDRTKKRSVVRANHPLVWKDHESSWIDMELIDANKMFSLGGILGCHCLDHNFDQDLIEIVENCNLLSAANLKRILSPGYFYWDVIVSFKAYNLDPENNL